MKKSPTVVSVINLKGGVGKTTVTMLLARHAATNWGLDVLAVDMDPQANLSQALMGEDAYIKFMEDQQSSIVELFNGYIPPRKNSPSPTKLHPRDVCVEVSGLDLIPSRFDFSDNLVKPMTKDDRVLAKFISEHMQHKDLILIDCAPTESVLTRACYHASRYVLIPVKTEFFSTIGFPLLNESLKAFRADNRGHQIDVCGVLVRDTKTSGSQRSADGYYSLEELQNQASANGWDIFENVMHHSDGYPKLAREHFPSYPGNAKDEWPSIADEILAKIGLSKSAGIP